MSDIFEQEEGAPQEKKLTVPEALQLLLHGFEQLGNSAKAQALITVDHTEQLAKLSSSLESLTKAVELLGDHLHELSMETSERYRQNQAAQESVDGEAN